jgi:hypothetical protein
MVQIHSPRPLPIPIKTKFSTQSMASIVHPVVKQKS